jgi:ribosomal protein S12 methylthiotransferase accessory factor
MANPARLKQLVSPLSGLIGRVDSLTAFSGEPQFPTYIAQLGDVGRVLSDIGTAYRAHMRAGEMDGAGGALDAPTALTRALAEALERYSSCVYSDRQFIWASAAELGDEALDLGSVPKCSERELAHPLCPLRAPDKCAPIRWVRGVSLMTCKPVWIPAVMVYLNIPWLSIGERFCLPISTGCAAHVGIEQALVNAISEVVERDAIALVWLQQMQLTRIEPEDNAELAPYLDRYARSHITPHFYDATTDLGIPTVYSVETAPHARGVATLVMCAADLDPRRAMAKVMREAASSRIALHVPHELPSDPDLFSGVFHGAVYMGAQERQDAFAFLLESEKRIQAGRLTSLDTGDAAANLRWLIERLRECAVEAYAVDLTSDEALAAGMRVVRAILPRLQPLTFSLRARYLAHPRLHEAPRRMGYPVRSEEEINPWPQPFA